MEASIVGPVTRVGHPRGRVSSVTPLTVPKFMDALRNHAQRHKVTGLRAFFTMEIYESLSGGGGLGTLSRDWLQECADEGLPIIAVTIAHRFIQHQRFDQDYWQEEKWVEVKLGEDPARVKLAKQVMIWMQGREILLDVWGRLIEGRNGEVVPVIELSTANCGIQGFDRITDRVYPGKHDWFATLGQEVVLGLGGVRALQELDVPIEVYHLNDGHPAFVAAQVAKNMGITSETLNEEAVTDLRRKIVYTSHTLIGAAADSFFPENLNDMIRDPDLRKIIGILGAQPVDGKLKTAQEPAVMEGMLDMAGMAMFIAGKINAVSKLNSELLRGHFPQHADRIVGGITNAVHPDWAAPPIFAVFDKFAPGWVEAPGELTKVADLRGNGEFRKEFWEAHMAAKIALVNLVRESRKTIEEAGLDPDIFGRELDPNRLTVGFARRVASYKRHDLLVTDLAALVASIAHERPLQFVFLGKAHTMDGDPGGGKAILQNLLRAGEKLNREYGDKASLVFLPNYDAEMARILIPGVDLWLNNPVWGLEASGTSTMDAILNGVLLATTDDGCVPEMREKGDIGWVFGRRNHPRRKEDDRSYWSDAYALYAVLSAASEAFYYGLKSGRFESGEATLWTDKMIGVVSKVLPYCLTPRMVGEYKLIWGL